VPSSSLDVAQAVERALNISCADMFALALQPPVGGISG
jgi:hypothetical protein